MAAWNGPKYIKYVEWMDSRGNNETIIFTLVSAPGGEDSLEVSGGVHELFVVDRVVGASLDLEHRPAGLVDRVVVVAVRQSVLSVHHARPERHLIRRRVNIHRSSHETGCSQCTQTQTESAASRTVDQPLLLGLSTAEYRPEEAFKNRNSTCLVPVYIGDKPYLSISCHGIPWDRYRHRDGHPRRTSPFNLPRAGHARRSSPTCPPTCPTRVHFLARMSVRYARVYTC